MTLLSLAYLGNIQYYTKLCFDPDCVIDVDEHFIKQSLRNRCHILSPNGPVRLTVPTIKAPNDRKRPLRDTRIDYSKRWQHNHWTSLVSAYRNSPYFDFYEERFAPFYTRRYDFLLDFNQKLTELALELLGSRVELRFSENYIDPASSLADFRHSISDKPRLHRHDCSFTSVPYLQVFGDRMAFVENLSIVDLLFCEGPHALTLLERCRA